MLLLLPALVLFTTVFLETKGAAIGEQIQSLVISCDNVGINIHVEFKGPFNGIIYSKGYYDNPNCRFVDAESGSFSYLFNIPANDCGTGVNNGTYYNTLIFQTHEIYQEVWDAARKISCDISSVIEKKLVAFQPFSVDMLHAFELSYSAGSNIQCWMDLQLGKGPFANTVNGIVKIGEMLTVVIYAKDDGLFDIHVKDCFAYDREEFDYYTTRSVQLTDEQGCALREKLLHRFYRTRNTGNTGASIIAFAFINAFKFPETNDVFLACNVEFCRENCINPCQPLIEDASEVNETVTSPPVFITSSGSKTTRTTVFRTVVSTKPTVRITQSTKPTIKTLLSTKPTARITRPTKSSVRTTRSSKPTVRTTQSTKSPLRTTQSTKPTVRTLHSTEPSVRTTQFTKSTVRYAQSTKPTVRTAQSTKHTVRYTQSTKPTVRTTQSIKSTVRYTQPTKPTVRTTQLSKIPVRLTEPITPTIQTSKAHQTTKATRSTLPTTPTTKSSTHTIHTRSTTKPVRKTTEFTQYTPRSTKAATATTLYITKRTQPSAMTEDIETTTKRVKGIKPTAKITYSTTARTEESTKSPVKPTKSTRSTPRTRPFSRTTTKAVQTTYPVIRTTKKPISSRTTHTLRVTPTVGTTLRLIDSSRRTEKVTASTTRSTALTSGSTVGSTSQAPKSTSAPYPSSLHTTRTRISSTRHPRITLQFSSTTPSARSPQPVSKTNKHHKANAFHAFHYEIGKYRVYVGGRRKRNSDIANEMGNKYLNTTVVLRYSITVLGPGERIDSKNN